MICRTSFWSLPALVLLAVSPAANADAIDDILRPACEKARDARLREVMPAMARARKLAAPFLAEQKKQTLEWAQKVIGKDLSDQIADKESNEADLLKYKPESIADATRIDWLLEVLKLEKSALVAEKAARLKAEFFRPGLKIKRPGFEIVRWEGVNSGPGTLNLRMERVSEPLGDGLDRLVFATRWDLTVTPARVTYLKPTVWMTEPRPGALSLVVPIDATDEEIRMRVEGEADESCHRVFASAPSASGQSTSVDKGRLATASSAGTQASTPATTSSAR